MNTTTLQGVFPDPKPTYRRNFIKENVRSIKQMQGILQDAGVIQPRPNKAVTKLKSNPRISKSRENLASNLALPLTRATGSFERFNKNKIPNKKPAKAPEALPLKPQPEKKKDSEPAATQNQRFSHRSVQTERTDDPDQLYQTGVIKYPSASIAGKFRQRLRTSRSPPLKVKETGAGDAVIDDIQNLEIEDKDFIKENKQNFRVKPKVLNTPKVPANPPANYQRGAVPKYLKERREGEMDREVEDLECPPGHVLLPEEERKETLRVLRQSYADRIQELNMMPVRSDTLKMKKRKMEIEEELKKIDGGIKVFQRPKVYVKINA